MMTQKRLLVLSLTLLVSAYQTAAQKTEFYFSEEVSFVKFNEHLYTLASSNIYSHSYLGFGLQDEYVKVYNEDCTSKTYFRYDLNSSAPKIQQLMDSSLQTIAKAIDKESNLKLLYLSFDGNSINEQTVIGYEYPKILPEQNGFKIVNLSNKGCYVTSPSNRLPNQIRALYTSKHSIVTIEHNDNLNLIGVECATPELWKVVEQVRGIWQDC